MVVKNFGEVCNHTDDCSDHRYVCTVDEDNVYRCTCDRFHSWMGLRYGCVQIYNATDILNITAKGHDYFEKVEKEIDKLYQQQAVAGLFVAAIFIFVIIAVIIYGIRIEKMDRTFKKQLVQIHRRHTIRQEGIPSTSFV